MNAAFLSTLFFIFLNYATFAQGTVRGKISDTKGETLIGATVALKTDPLVATSTDLNGNYTLDLPVSGELTIQISSIGYSTVERTVTVPAGGAAVLNVEMVPESKELGGVKVKGKARKSGDPYLEKLKISSGPSIDYISSDQMVRTGDPDAAQAVKRVSGVSTVSGFVTVRGLADRYLVTTVNGSRIPTLDPLTNNLRLDLFPTGLMDNIIITKTATPDLPGDWSGAFISLNTSDYPQKLKVNIVTTIGYNPNTTGQSIVSATSSSTDWLGHDDGMRGIPDGVPSDQEQFPVFIDPDLYQQLTLLGLQGTLDGYGITATTPGFQSTTMGTINTLQHVVLTDLGLLAPGLIYDANAVQNAVNTYNSTYNLAYFSPLVNGELADLNTRFNNSNWRVKDVKGSPNFTQAFSIGNQVRLFKKKKRAMTLGYLVGFRYNTDTDYDGSATQERSGESVSSETQGTNYDLKGDMRISTVSNGWNAIGSLSLTANRNNSFSLLVMPNALGQNNARYNVFLKPSVSGETFVSEDQFYEERKLWVYQYGSKHFIPAWRMKMDLDASYSDGERDVLDFKTVQYIRNADGTLGSDGALAPPARIYRFLNETLFDARAGFELPLTDKDEKARKLKFGASYRNNTRKNQQSYYTILGAPGPNDWEQPGRFDMRADGTFASQYNPFGTFKDNDIGILEIWSGFVMTDYEFTQRIRVVGGLRAEHTDMITDILRYYEEGLAPDDPARGTVGDVAIGGSGTPEPQPAVPGTIDQWDLLPSINFIYGLKDKDDESGPMNLRLSYFRSLGRPSFREFSVVQLYDYLLNAPVFGNPDLKMTTIDNYDVRVERFFSNRNNISISGFYKEFRNHIELLSTVGSGFTWRNADFSRIFGLEIEGRVGLTRNLEARGNVTFMDSRSDLTFNINGIETKYSTPMYGQAPYIVNAMLTWSLDTARFSVSLSYNVQGPKLAVSNSELAPEAVRAYEMPRHLVDLTLQKAFGEHWGVRLRARNLLDAPMRRAYKFDTGYNVDFDNYQYGPEYSISIQYTIK